MFDIMSDWVLCIETNFNAVVTEFVELRYENADLKSEVMELTAVNNNLAKSVGYQGLHTCRKLLIFSGPSIKY